MKRPKISRRAETRPYGRVSAPTGNCRKFLTQLRPAWSHIPDAPSRTPAGKRTARPPACSARAAAAARAGHAGWRHPRASRRYRSRAGQTYPPEPRLLPATCGNGVRIDGSRSAAPASSLSSADTGKRPSASCLPPMHSPCVPSSDQCTASWPHGSRSPGTSPDPQRSPPVPAPGRAAPASPRTAIDSTFEARYGTRTQGKIRNRELFTTPFRRFARSRSRQPIQASRQGSRVVPASNSRQPSLRPRRSRSQ